MRIPMRTQIPNLVCETNLTRAWAGAFRHAYADPHDAGPLVVSINLSGAGEPEEITSIRKAVDEALKHEGKVSVVENAAMLFPIRTWSLCQAQGREAFYEEYLNQILPRLKA